MNIRSAQSGHWTDDDLLAFMYGIGPSGNHLDGCSDCQSRLQSMRLNRQHIEQCATSEEGVSATFLVAQRRTIYQRMEQPSGGWHSLPGRRWAAGITTACVLGGSLFVYQHNRQAQLAQERISDAKLAQDVAMMAQDAGVSSMAPLEGLFE